MEAQAEGHSEALSSLWLFLVNFVIQRSYHDRGVLAVCSTRPYRISPDLVLKPGEVPLGSVEWTERCLCRSVAPDYLPTFLSDHLHRRVWTETSWPLGKRCFIKPLYRHKAWKAKVYSGRGYSGKKKGPYLCSEVVRFRNEYRYYVANGKVLSGWWYWGDSQDTEQRHEGPNPPDAPSLPEISWPQDYCGAVDFGELWDSGQLVLIEANAPFSCGWYGEREYAEHYSSFLESGWIYLNKYP